MTKCKLSVTRYKEMFKAAGSVWRETYGKAFTRELNRGVHLLLTTTTKHGSAGHRGIWGTGLGVFNLSYPSRMAAWFLEYLSPHFEEL